MIIAVIFHCVQVSHNGLVGLVCQSLEKSQFRHAFVFVSLHIEGHKGFSRGVLDRILFKFMEAEVYFRVFIKKSHLAANYLYETHLEANLAQSQSKVSLLGQETNEGVAPGLGAKNDSDLCSVKEVVFSLLFDKSKDAVGIFSLSTDELPEGRVNGSPRESAFDLGTNLYSLEFEVV